MIEEILAPAVAITAYVSHKVLGPTLDEMGIDLKEFYNKNFSILLEKAEKKVINLDEGAKVNLRVAHDVAVNGGFTNDGVCAEYFSGILAASMSADEMDDSALPFVGSIKALSSKQLHLHYAIYSLMHKLLSQSNAVDPVMQDEDAFLAKQIWFVSEHLERLGIKPDMDLRILQREDLISKFSTGAFKNIHATSVQPSLLGVMLFAVAHNQLTLWKHFGHATFPDCETEITLPTFYTSTFDDMLIHFGCHPHRQQ